MGRAVGNASHVYFVQVHPFNSFLKNNQNSFLTFISASRRDFIIFTDINSAPVQITDNKFSEKIILCQIGQNHFDSVFTKSFIDSTAICQGTIRSQKDFRFCGIHILLALMSRIGVRTTIWRSLRYGRYRYGNSSYVV